MLSLNQHIEEVRAGLRAGRFGNEAAVSQGVVLRILGAVGWPAYDTQVVMPEFALQGRRVDYALCHPPAKPRVFIEVKQTGQADGAERQLFEYAFHAGVPLAVLTDGQEWNFFLPAEAGDYGERRVYKLDLLERDVAESARRLERYLSYEATCSGKAHADARADYQDVARERQTRDTLPQAWAKLVEEADDLLVELLADRVESLCGYKPDPNAVAAFLRDKIALRHGEPPRVSPVSRHAAPVNAPRPAGTAAVGVPSFGFNLNGDTTSCRNGREVLIKAIEAFAASDGTFLERFAALPHHGRRRRYIASNRADLYPGRPDLAEEHSYQLASGHWLGINVSHNAIERILRIGCDVLGLRYGKDFAAYLS